MHVLQAIGLRGFGLAGYRSFDGDGFFLEGIRKINVFIGKNNSGKSNVLRAIRVLRDLGTGANNVHLDQIRDHHNRASASPIALLNIDVTALQPEDRSLFSEERSVSGPERFKELHKKMQAHWGDSVRMKVDIATGDLIAPSPAGGLPEDLFDEFASRLPPRGGYGKQAEQVDHLLAWEAQKTLRVFDSAIVIPNFRQLYSADVKEITSGEPAPSAPLHIEFDGENIVARLREMQHPLVGREKEQETFKKVKGFVSDLLGAVDIELEVPLDEDVIIVTMGNRRSELESFGTGVHQLVILCSALAIHDNHVVCIEEPEIHLHPELQRKFLKFIVEQTNNTYFITTHSNVFLDFTPEVALYHVRHNGVASVVERADTSEQAREVLLDMGYKASDLLQANCVLWVEGPSDRIFLNKWLSLVAPELVETIHYSVAFYGGKVLAHFCAKDDPVGDLVQVLRINRNAYFMIDRDGDSEASELRKDKARIQEEIGEAQCWITEGREVENYLSPHVVSRFLTERCGPNSSEPKSASMTESVANPVAHAAGDACPTELGGSTGSVTPPNAAASKEGHASQQSDQPDNTGALPSRGPISVTFGRDDKITDAIEEAVKAAGSKLSPKYSKDKVGYAREIIKQVTDADLDVLDLRERLQAMAALIRKWNNLR